MVGLTLSAVSGMQMTGSIVAGLIVDLIPIVLAIRSRNSVRWFLGVFQPRFPSARTRCTTGQGRSAAAQGRSGKPRA